MLVILGHDMNMEGIILTFASAYHLSVQTRFVGTMESSVLFTFVFELINYMCVALAGFVNKPFIYLEPVLGKSNIYNMDGLQVAATSLAVIAIVLLMVLMVCQKLGPKATAWVCSNREEKIGLSKSKIFNANGYLVRFNLNC